ncbi:hypothetical protein Q31b_46840 [Novipirellula aureliae]|uniref:Uncharacterized protein n=1 Tax=Novipirellula aureliae TaxID=2527966 RepID=A0A5C6DNW1_9BACT|nr:hypothetical protein Q31b_46840 [Novipirellula aureliae]
MCASPQTHATLRTSSNIAVKIVRRKSFDRISYGTIQSLWQLSHASCELVFSHLAALRMIDTNEHSIQIFY